MRNIIFLLPFFILACAEETVEFVEVKVDNSFSVELPNYMEELDLQSPEASLQFGNELKEHYVTVLVESNEQFAQADVHMNLKEYSEFYVDHLKKGLTNPTIDKLHEGFKDVNGLQAAGFKVKGLMEAENLEIISYVMFYQSAIGFYYLSTWTLANRENKLGAYMERIAYSLKEL